MNWRLVWSAASLAIGSSACSTSPSVAAISAMGTVSGHAIGANVGLWQVDAAATDGAPPPSEVLTVALTTSAEAGCPTPGTFPGTSILMFQIPVPSTAFEPGLYAVGIGDAAASNSDILGADAAVANIEILSASCGTVDSERATLGIIALSALSSSQVAGSFDLRFSGSDHVSGTFAMPVCVLGLDAGDAAPDSGSVCTP